MPLGSFASDFVGEVDLFLFPKFVMGVAERFSSLMWPFMVREGGFLCALGLAALTTASNADSCSWST